MNYWLPLVLMGCWMGGFSQDSLATVDLSEVQNAVEADSGQRRKILFTGSAASGINYETTQGTGLIYNFGFLPLILWKPDDKLFFESHFHIALESAVSGTSGHSHGNTIETKGVSMELAYCDLSWFINKHFTLTAGYFPSPFGLFNERLHPDWVNKLPDAPLGMGHINQVGPSAEFGVQLRTTFRWKKLRMNAVAYVSNGPALDISTENAGMLTYNAIGDNNSSKAVGFRYGILLPSASPVELGFSGQFAKVAPSGTIYERARADLFAFDMAWTELSDKLKGDWVFKSQLNFSRVDKADYWIYDGHRSSFPSTIQHVGGDNSSYRFDNVCYAAFVYQTYRPSHSKLKIISRLEQVFRIDILSLAPDAEWAQKDRRWTFGLAYHIGDRSLLKYAYQVGMHANYMMLQWVAGL